MNNIKVTIGSVELNIIVRELLIDMKMNSYTKCLIEFSYSRSYTYQEIKDILSKNNICIYSVEEECVVFCGFFEEYEFRTYNDDEITRIVAYSYTKILDTDYKNCSFQNVNLLYKDVINEVVANYSNVFFLFNANNLPINRLFIRYNETAWDFIKRIISNLGTVLYDIPCLENPYFWVGSENHLYEYDFSEYQCKSGIDEGYFKQGGTLGELSRADYIYYELLCRKNFQIGKRTLYNGYEMVIYEKEVTYIESEWKYKYKLGKLPVEKVIPIKNYNFTGMSLTAEVIDVKNECVKVRFDIDESQDVSTAYEYDWTPFSGNLFYCPPKIGTRVSVYINSANEVFSQAINCIRTNGANCTEMSNYSDRGFLTEHGKGFTFSANELSFNSGTSKNPTQNLSLLENIFIISANKHLSILSNDNIEIRANNCYMKCLKDMALVQSNLQGGLNSGASINISGEINCYGNVDELIVSGERIIHDFFDDNPIEGDNKALVFDILAKSIIAAVAVVAVVAVVAAAGIITGGVAAAAIVGAVVAVAAVGVCDYIDGNSSSFGSYFIRAVTGAITGAVFSGVGEAVTFSSKFGVYALQNIGLGTLSGLSFESIASITEVLTGAEEYSAMEVVENILSAGFLGGIAGGIFGAYSYLSRLIFSKTWFASSKLLNASDQEIRNMLGQLRNTRTNVSTQELYKELMKIYGVTTRAELRVAISKDPIKMILNYSNFKVMPGEIESSTLSELIQDIISFITEDIEKELNTDYELDYVVVAP